LAEEGTATLDATAFDGGRADQEQEERAPDLAREGAERGSPKTASVAAVSTLALATAACGGGGGGSTGGAPPIGGTPTPTAPPVLRPSTDAEAARFALRAGLSVTPGDITEMRSDGYEAWLDREIAQPIERSAQQFLSSLGFEQINDDQWFFRSDPADYMIWNQLLTGSNSVRKRIALALSEFLVVSVNNIQIWPSSSIGAYWDILKEGAFGNFREVLEGVTLDAAMGVFLNTLGNQKADPATGRVPDENFGREIMQLFSIGLFELNIDGSVRTDGSGDPIETYTNEDVTGIAKVFTGYNYNYSGGIQFTDFTLGNGNTIPIPDAALMRNPMTANPALQVPNRGDNHSLEEKTFLGTTIPAGTGAAESLRIALDTLFQHPNVGPFFGQQMIQRLVTSNPSPAYVQRVAETFNDNGSGVRGDLRSVFKAILLDDEALSAQSLDDPEFGKLREPILRFAQWGRTFGAQSDTGFWLMQDLSERSNRLGQSPLRSPSVFNFFRPGFTPPNSQSAERDLLAPEFQLVNETTAASYVNFMERTIDGRGGWMFDVKATYSAELEIAHDTPALLDRLDLLLTAGQLSQDTRDTIAGALGSQSVTPDSAEEDKLRQIHRAVLLVMISTDYLVQR